MSNAKPAMATIAKVPAANKINVIPRCCEAWIPRLRGEPGFIASHPSVGGYLPMEVLTGALAAAPDLSVR